MNRWMSESRNPSHRPTLKDFLEASKRLKGVALRTPLIPLPCTFVARAYGTLRVELSEDMIRDLVLAGKKKGKKW